MISTWERQRLDRVLKPWLSWNHANIIVWKREKKKKNSYNGDLLRIVVIFNGFFLKDLKGLVLHLIRNSSKIEFLIFKGINQYGVHTYEVLGWESFSCFSWIFIWVIQRWFGMFKYNRWLEKKSIIRKFDLPGFQTSLDVSTCGLLTSHYFWKEIIWAENWPMDDLVGCGFGLV